ATSPQTTRAPLLDDLDRGLVVAAQNLVRDLALRRPVGRLERVRAKPLSGDDGDECVGEDPAEGRPNGEFFESAHLPADVRKSGGIGATAAWAAGAERGTREGGLTVIRYG